MCLGIRRQALGLHPEPSQACLGRSALIPDTLSLSAMKAHTLCWPPGVGLRPPRRADLAPRKSAKQAVPDRPVQTVDIALALLLTAS